MLGGLSMFTETDIKYLTELAKSYPTKSAVLTEIINLNAILNLPKGTEHFMSDLHGEHEAFSHIRRNASGVVRRKVDALFERSLTKKERSELATLIYYPEEKLEAMAREGEISDDWYNVTLVRLLEVCRFVSSKYTRSKVRKHLAKTTQGYDYIIDELLNNDYDAVNKGQYYTNILAAILNIDAAADFIIALCSAIKSMVIDHLHIVGDIFDRGPRADLIIDELMKETSIDIQWGNHDVLWMGAAAGSRVCIATVLNNSITYKNLDVVEIGYGISLRPLTLFANEVYGACDVSSYMPKGDSEGDKYLRDDDVLVARMHKAISVIQFKLEGQAILRNPDFNMEHRLLLDKINWGAGTVLADGKEYSLKDTDFPTIDRENPYLLTPEETEVMRYLKNAFMRSEKLQAHARFLYEKGEIYTIFNKNLLFHGCIPIEDDGSFMKFSLAQGKSGKAFMDFCDKAARQGYFAKEGSIARSYGKDFLWFLWCGKDSPLCARKKIATFERLLIEDKSAWEEPKNAYYRSWNDEKIVQKILEEFGLGGERSHIVNGHIPVQKKKGETPLKASGKLILIDGGFCRAYQASTGIAGYTLIYNADGMRISAHEPFRGIDDAISNNTDILSDTVIFEHSADKIRVKDTDTGKRLAEKINDLMKLLEGYESGFIKEGI
ncbi:MAG: fructose-1,6-bisphosphatase [Clostridia bacterium]|nr:fructose-1,6-bisphosphatase [Clostridia bacterium]